MPFSIRIGFGNVYGGESLSHRRWGDRVDNCATLVRSMPVDLFVATEMRSKNGMYQDFANRLGSDWGVAMGSSYKNSDTHLYYRKALYSVTATEFLPTDHRTFTFWRVRQTSTGLEAWVSGVHFLYGGQSSGSYYYKNRLKIRAKQAAAMVKWFGARKEIPGIWVGDINTSSKAKGSPRDILKIGGWFDLRSKFAGVVKKEYNSHPGMNKVKKKGAWIDDIFTRSSAVVTAGALVESNGVSDHNFIAATVDLAPAAKPITTPEPILAVEPPSIHEPFELGGPFREAPPGYQSLSIEVWSARTFVVSGPDPDSDDADADAEVDAVPAPLPTYYRRGVVASPTSAAGSLVVNSPGTFSFTVDADHPRVADLTEPGARAVVLYRYAPGSPTRPLISGAVHEVKGSGPRSSAQRTFAIRDDWMIFNEVLGLPSPSKDLTQQGADSAFFTAKGDAETVLKTVLAPNAARQGVAVKVPSSYGRGSQVEVSLRMHPLADRLFPALTDAGLVVRVLQVGAERYLLVSEPTTRSRVLTEESGVVLDGDFTLTPPTVTRVIVGSGGEGTSRTFAEYVDEELEATYGFTRSTFVDAGQIDPAAADVDAALQAKADEALAAGSPRVALKAVLAETSEFRFGKAYELGDFVSLRLSGSPDLTDRVREIQLDWSVEDGLVLTPLVGDWSDSTSDELYQAVSVLARSARDASRR